MARTQITPVRTGTWPLPFLEKETVQFARVPPINHPTHHRYANQEKTSTNHPRQLTRTNNARGDLPFPLHGNQARRERPGEVRQGRSKACGGYGYGSHRKAGED